MTNKHAKPRDKARDRALRAVRKEKQHVASFFNAYTKHYDDMLEAGQRVVETGEVSFESLFADTLAFTLDCYSTLTDCLYSCATDSDEFDELSEAAGPILIPGFGSASATARRLPPVRMDGSGASISRRRVSLRKLDDGQLHFALTDLTLMPLLPVDEYVGVASGTTFGMTKVKRERVSLQFGTGVVPAYLQGDPLLHLDTLLFK